MAYRDCPHTPGITCDSKYSCKRCGWFPKEAERRKKMIQAGKLEENYFGKSGLYIKKNG